MDRSIPHVLDIFVSSPGERRRILAKAREEEKFASQQQLKEQQKNPGSDSAVCLCSSSDEDERNISKYFDYLNNEFGDASSACPKRKKSATARDEGAGTPGQQKQQPRKNREETGSKGGLEKDIKHIERHLSMKKTIRKKMMRDLQQAFVEDPKEFQQDPECIPSDRKNNINIQNLTISKRRMSKSEHSFLDMLKENEHKDRKSCHGRTSSEATKAQKNQSHSHSKRSFTPSSSRSKSHEDDSGNDSPTRAGGGSQPSYQAKHPKGKGHPAPPKDEKKGSFWQRLTGKGKSKR